MPFDSIAQDKTTLPTQLITNTLEAIGVQPVSRELAEKHKAEVLAHYVAGGKYFANLVNIGQARWDTRVLSRRRFAEPPRFYEDPLSFVPTYERQDFSAIKRQMAISAGGAMSTPDRSAAPIEIVNAAAMVHKNIEQAIFSLEYFYDDPILNVSYMDSTGAQHHDCLGIWDQGKVIAIASGCGVYMPEVKPSWLTRIREFFN